MPKKQTPSEAWAAETIRTHEEAVRKGRAGGKKSGEVRRKKKNMREAMEAMLSLPMREGALNDPKCFEDIFSVLDFDHRKEKVMNVQVAEAVVAAQVREAIGGNVKAAEFIAKVMGQEAMGLSQSEDGFMEALNGVAKQDWSDGDEDPE